VLVVGALGKRHGQKHPRMAWQYHGWFLSVPVRFSSVVLPRYPWVTYIVVTVEVR